MYSDLSCFFSPADGVILYQREVRPDESIVEIKGRAYSLNEALKQNLPVLQGERFSQVRSGSQVDLIVPPSDRFDFGTLQNTGDHAEAGIDPIIKVSNKTKPERNSPS
jgi:phosphatidylserine decarboxylase